jgi:hypothetical protein
VDRTASTLDTDRVEVVIDLENLLVPVWDETAGRVAVALVATVRRIAREYGSKLAGFGCGDRRLVRRLVHPSLGWLRMFPWAAGPDRADAELLRRLRDVEETAVGTVVLVTGDGGFAPAVARLRAQGRRVVVVGHARHVSWRLHRVASEVRLLDGWDLAA